MNDVEKKYMTNQLIEQLHGHGFYNTDGKSYRELKHKLAVLRATEIKTGNPENEWF